MGKSDEHTLVAQVAKAAEDMPKWIKQQQATIKEVEKLVNNPAKLFTQMLWDTNLKSMVKASQEALKVDGAGGPTIEELPSLMQASMKALKMDSAGGPTIEGLTDNLAKSLNEQPDLKSLMQASMKALKMEGAGGPAMEGFTDNLAKSLNGQQFAKMFATEPDRGA